MNACRTGRGPREIMTKLFADKTRLTLVSLGVLVGILLPLRFGQIPPIWFDEGWAFEVGRAWVQQGHYGYYLSGQPVPPSILNTGMPALAPIALSFRLLGVGIWQGRLPGVFFTAGALAALYYLARRLYNRSVAVGALAAALLLSGSARLHPILMGRQALGEMPALFFVLTGYAFFSQSRKRQWWALPLSVLFWSLGLRTKPQVLPFFAASMIFPLAVSTIRRQRRTAGSVALGLSGGLAATALFAWTERLLLRVTSPGTPTSSNPYAVLGGLSALQTYVFDLTPHARIAAFLLLLLFGTPTVLGLSHAGGSLARTARGKDPLGERDVARLAVWAFAASWLAWYLFFSMGVGRYLFPALFVGSLFVAALVWDLAGGFNPLRLLSRGPAAVKQRRPFAAKAVRLLLAVAIPALFLSTVIALAQTFTAPSDNSALQTAQYLNNHTSPDALIETYDSELFFMLQRRYHYPPNSVQEELNRRVFQGNDDPIHYDALEADPGYLVVGPGSRDWNLYDPALATGAFRLIQAIGRYDIYERVRSP
jgi:4-amino-4-deoxy-L-arabinose transferase-like glycosyltransferase